LKVYLDTSVLIPLLVHEANSAAVERWMEKARHRDIAVSDWTILECASAIGRKGRERKLSARQADEVRSTLGSMADDSLIVFTPAHADFSLASEYLRDAALGLRAGDALHLAIAVKHGALPVYSLDRLVIAAGRKLQIKVESPV
jgi:hypothetical protein